MGLFGMDEEEKYQIAISMPLDDKIKRAVDMIKMYEPMALQLWSDGYHLGDSGGKDSCTVLALARMAGVKFKALYGNTTVDHPLLVKFIKDKHPDTIFLKQKKARHPGAKYGRTINFYSEVKYHAGGLPTRRGAWCCEIYKHHQGDNRLALLGIRAEESPKRKIGWREVITDNKNPTICPILYWTKENIWDFIKLYKVEYCELYDPPYNMDRIGCYGPCPKAGKKRVDEFKSYPYAEMMSKKAAREWWEKYSKLKKEDGSDYWAAKFKSWEDYWSWWMEEDANDSSEDCQLNLW